MYSIVLLTFGFFLIIDIKAKANNRLEDNFKTLLLEYESINLRDLRPF